MFWTFGQAEQTKQDIWSHHFGLCELVTDISSQHIDVSDQMINRKYKKLLSEVSSSAIAVAPSSKKKHDWFV